MEADPGIVEAVQAWLAASPSATMKAHYGTGGGMRYGVTLHPDGITAWPGGMTLLHVRRPPPSIMPLDYAFDMPDGVVDLLRHSIMVALESREVPFLPVSPNAFSRIGEWHHDLVLVERVGLQCVFTHDETPYLSGYDANESPPLYFLARLPHPVTSVADGLESLKPPSVKEAERLGMTVLRQGDMFAIQTPYCDDNLHTMGATFIQGPGRGLYGTAHYGTRMAQLPDGTMLARGTLIHSPALLNQNRRPDHHPMKLPGKLWWLIVRNTVPVAPPRETPRVIVVRDGAVVHTWGGDTITVSGGGGGGGAGDFRRFVLGWVDREPGGGDNQ